MHIIFLLSSLLFPLFLFAFESLYSINPKNFEIIESKNSYKLILKDQKFFNYKENDGFKFFIPYFTKEYNLKVLRFNSVGYINGLLSMDKSFSKITKNPTLEYYLTDYKSNSRQLDYLLKGITIPYYKTTSLSIEAYNIPTKIQKKLNKYIYFKKIPIKNNKLQYILYSCYILLDKKNVDNYIKTHYPTSKEPIKTFIKNIYSLDLKPIKKPKKQTKKSPPKPSFHLNLTRIHQMKTYGFLYTPSNEIEKIKEDLINRSFEINNNLEDLRMEIYNSFNKVLNLSADEKIKKLNQKIENLSKKISNFPEIKEEKCKFDPKNIKKECFKNPIYFHNFIHYQIKNDTLPSVEKIIAYGDYKTFNDVGVYFYNKTDFKKAEIFLNKAYILADNKTLPAHNLSVLYLTKSELFDAKKAIEYLKKSNLDIDYYNLGVYYYIGIGVKENDKKAREYFKKAKSISLAKKNLEIMDKYKIGLK